MLSRLFELGKGRVQIGTGEYAWKLSKLALRSQILTVFLNGSLFMLRSWVTTREMLMLLWIWPLPAHFKLYNRFLTRRADYAFAVELCVNQSKRGRLKSLADCTAVLMFLGRFRYVRNCPNPHSWDQNMTGHFQRFRFRTYFLFTWATSNWSTRMMNRPWI